MEYKELATKGVNELTKMLSEERGNLYDLQLKVSINQLKNVRALRNSKKTIAKLQTAIASASGKTDSKEEVIK